MRRDSEAKDAKYPEAGQNKNGRVAEDTFFCTDTCSEWYIPPGWMRWRGQEAQMHRQVGQHRRLP